MGYMHAAIRQADDARVGDTVCAADADVTPLKGFKPAKPMVSDADVTPLKGFKPAKPMVSDADVTPLKGFKPAKPMVSDLALLTMLQNINAVSRKRRCSKSPMRGSSGLGRS